ncbi:hypothetical protein ABIB25_003637 [Nakamurella sp. UYEF19]|uniref:LytR C-terminal domain-containing protein n=1 Tax=Nakamurella sp. UYEF19 TaxID=1756392 RepID=UPI003397A08E
MSPDSPADRYHRRRRAPILVVIVVLLLGTGVAWFQVLKPVPAASTSCNQPGPAPVLTSSTSRSSAASGGGTASRPGASGSTGTARTGATATSGTARTSGTAASASASATTPTTPIVTSLGSFANIGSLTGVRPADPAIITLQVFNASPTRGQAKTVTNDLRTNGFASILGGANDPLYPAFDLACTAEIRYGQAGTAAARTLLLVAPCAQLVLDDRISDSVDLALGARYVYTPLAKPVAAQLKTIHDAAIPPAVIEGQTAAARPAAVIPPLPSSAAC